MIGPTPEGARVARLVIGASGLSFVIITLIVASVVGHLT